MKKIFALAILATFLFGCVQSGIDNPEISTEELKAHIGYLASDSLTGRLPGTEGDFLAADYIRNEFRSFGYSSLNEDYFQGFEVIAGIEAGNNTMSFEDTEAELNKNFIPLNFSASTSAEGEVVFCGYGFDINRKGFSWFDYEGQDITGKWVMILRADPELDNEESIFADYSSDRSKVLTAKDKGAAGVLIVSGTDYNKKDVLTKLLADHTGTSSALPAFNITRELANTVLSQAGKNIEDLEKQLMDKREPASFSTGVILEAAAEVNILKAQTQNVIGYLEGSDPVLKDEIIVIGGHYDHLGMGGPTTGSRVPDEHAIHYGADDNASGVATVIEIAEKLASVKEGLKRSVIVMAFAGEEMGLLGSKHFTAEPPVEMEKIVAMINVDMVGRLKPSNELMVGGTGTSAETEALLDTLLLGTGLKLAKSKNGLGPSDHAAFYTEEIPVFFFSTGAHEDYHTPRDVIEMINFEGLKKLDDYVYMIMEDLVNRDTKLTFQQAGPMKQDTGARRVKGVTMGIMPSFTDTANNGMGIDGVTPGKPAEQAGLLKGDIIVAIEGKEVTNIYDYMARMKALDFGQTITVDVIRDGEKKVFIVQLAAK